MSALGRLIPPAIDDDTVAALVDAFYRRVRQDAMPAPVFVQAIGVAAAFIQKADRIAPGDMRDA